jgi:L-amino acid N-acyltransferase YncA
MLPVVVRRAAADDLPAIREIYNQGIDDRIATLETLPKTSEEIAAWFKDRDQRYAVIVACDRDDVVGWASLNRFSPRRAHSAIADLSVYVARTRRGCGVGTTLLEHLEPLARSAGFHKIVLHALNRNETGKRLYRAGGFREVGVFEKHGTLDGTPVDVVAMEKLL